MSKDGRDVLEVLKFELHFLEQGGYGRSVRTPWKPTSAFQDSLSCPNFGDPNRPHACDECLLHDFVPDQYKAENVPCHFIPINAHGETVDSMKRQYTQPEMEDSLREWLRQVIKRIETGRAQTATPAAPNVTN